MRQRLLQFPHLAALASVTLECLVRCGSPRTLAADERVIRQGEPGHALLIVLHGRLKMTRSLENGREVLLALFNPGDLVGVAAGLGGQVSDASVTAMESSLCLELPREPLLEALAGEPGLLADLLPVLTRRVAECGNCVVEGTFFRVEPRIARLLLKLAESVGRQEDGEDNAVFVPVPLSRQDLADMAGTTLETSIRILSRWGKEDLVETRPDGFLIRRPRDLEALCGG
ncbi:MAG: Crp/Fnr family transcriptional regulator [Acidobacteriota bacterium]|nr:Crp/Fnr family transcriptional regulator [Acidobacteriota bacterium]